MNVALGRQISEPQSNSSFSSHISLHTPKKVQQQVKGVRQKKPQLFVQSELPTAHHLHIRLVEVAASNTVKVSGGRIRKRGPPFEKATEVGAGKARQKAPVRAKR